MPNDPYKVLGVRRDASQQDIQKAHRDLAMKYHPDKNPDDKTAKKKFQEVQEAFDLLNDPKKREMFDRYGSSFEQMGGGGAGGAGSPGGGGSFRFTGSDFDDIDLSQVFARFGGPGGGRAEGGSFGDIFEQFQGAGRGGPRARGGRRADPAEEGADIEHQIEVPFAVAIKGGEAQLRVQRPDGHEETITVKIPAGIADGKRIRLRGQGEQGVGGAPPGDMLIAVTAAPHPCFTRHGDDLHVKVPVTLGEAAAGAKVDVPTPNGIVTLKVPPGTSSGKKLRVRGQGAARAGETPGDLYAEIQVVLPDDLSDAERETLREIDSRHPQDPRSDLAW